MRPGIRFPWGMYALSNTKPHHQDWVGIKAEQVVSDHFKAKGPIVYLIVALNTATRYNNVSGGVLLLRNQIEQEFLGLNPSSHIFSLTTTQFFSHMKLLVLSFELLINATKETFGLSAESTFTPDTAYELALKSYDEMSDDEKLLSESSAWQNVMANMARCQIKSLLNNLPFPDATPEMVDAIPEESLQDAINYVTDLLAGNPTDDNDPAALAVMGLEEWLGTADLDGYTTPATNEQVADALVEDPEADATEEIVDTPADEPATETVAEEDVEEEVAEESAGIVATDPAQTQVIASTNFITMNQLVEARKELKAIKISAEKALDRIDDGIINSALNMAQHIDGAALPANVDAEELAVEA